MKYKSCSGFTLLEVLIAAVVMSFGLLGLAGLQMTSLKNTHTASITSQASMLAYSMADRIRADPEGYSTAEWSHDVEAVLPGGRGGVSINNAACRINHDNDNGNLIQIWWDQNQDGIEDKPYEFCFVL